MTGQRLRQLRERKGESLAAVGRAIGVTGQAIGRYEREQDQPGGLILAKLAEHFEVSATYLLGQTDDPFQDAALPSGWDRIIRAATERGYTPEEVEQALRMLQAYRDSERRGD